ncbi:hypothetical protein [Flavihumibacter sp. ZG627]|uniref:hypothetical protein n=1 Tax=Flavihumibacter sp. ZG627 TaxID=1463156 RepID=UPI00057E44E1|nr:hypothetical protein [Flavihumibacter sp. ZG627]KIC91681.1 hypothetical protein HY58_05475 [Flavihumibacter sp. ZG627]
MRKLFLLLMLVPFYGNSQEKNVINATRVFPKPDKVAEFEKAIAAHAQKFHTGDYKWRVAEIMSGPDAGGYTLVEGPHTWDQVDKRGDLGAAHQADWNKNIAIHLSQKTSSLYAVYLPDLSTVKPDDYSEKYAINHVFFKPGMYGEIIENYKGLKKMWEADKMNIAVYESSSSGAPQLIVVTRYKDGLKERQTGFRKPFPERYVAANGAGSFEKWLEVTQKTVDHQWGEMLFTRADLGSK